MKNKEEELQRSVAYWQGRMIDLPLTQSKDIGEEIVKRIIELENNLKEVKKNTSIKPIDDDRGRGI